MLSMIEEIIRDLLIFVAVMFALSIVLHVVVSKMPDDNPLKRIMTALSYRVGATLAGRSRRHPHRAAPGTRRALRHRRSDPSHLVLVHILPRCDPIFGRVRHRPHGDVAATRRLQTDRKLPKPTTFENL